MTQPELAEKLEAIRQRYADAWSGDYKWDGEDETYEQYVDEDEMNRLSKDLTDIINLLKREEAL